MHLIHSHPKEAQQAEEDRLGQSITRTVSLVNADQRAAFDAVVGSVLPGVSSADLTAVLSLPAIQRRQHDRVFLLDAPGGTGKTFVNRAIHDFFFSASL